MTLVRHDMSTSQHLGLPSTNQRRFEIVAACLHVFEAGMNEDQIKLFDREDC